MGLWNRPITFLGLTFLAVCSTSAFTTQTVHVQDTVTLLCNRTIDKDTPLHEYDIKWVTAKNDLVVHYHQGELTAGDWFEGRVSISKDDTGFGNFYLNISPVEYNDGDLYLCLWNGKLLSEVRLEVLVPTLLPVQFGESATLPCYFQVDKRAKSEDVSGRWEKDGQFLLGLLSGVFNKSSGSENRYNMPVDKVRFGDLSLIISKVHHLDRGTYRCFCEGKTVEPDDIVLTIEAHHNDTSIQSGESLSLQLYSSDPVRVLFRSDKGSADVPVCTVKGQSGDCEPQYQDRVSIQNTDLTLDSVTSHDSGVYTVIDHKTNGTISTITVRVIANDTGSTQQGVLPGVLPVVLVVLVVVVGVGVCVCLKRRSCCTQEEPPQEESEPMRVAASLVPNNPEQENGEEEQLSTPVPVSEDPHQNGDGTEDKPGTKPWNDGNSSW